MNTNSGIRNTLQTDQQIITSDTRKKNGKSSTRIHLDNSNGIFITKINKEGSKSSARKGSNNKVPCQTRARASQIGVNVVKSSKFDETKFIAKKVTPFKLSEPMNGFKESAVTWSKKSKIKGFGSKIRNSIKKLPNERSSSRMIANDEVPVSSKSQKRTGKQSVIIDESTEKPDKETKANHREERPKCPKNKAEEPKEIMKILEEVEAIDMSKQQNSLVTEFRLNREQSASLNDLVEIKQTPKITRSANSLSEVDTLRVIDQQTESNKTKDKKIPDWNEKLKPGWYEAISSDKYKPTPDQSVLLSRAEESHNKIYKKILLGKLEKINKKVLNKILRIENEEHPWQMIYNKARRFQKNTNRKRDRKLEKKQENIVTHDQIEEATIEELQHLMSKISKNIKETSKRI